MPVTATSSKHERVGGHTQAADARTTSRRGLRPAALFPWLTLTAFLAPVILGLLGALLPAFGWHPSLAGRGIGLEPWRELMAQPGVFTAMRLSLTTGFAAALLALLLAVGIVAALHGGRLFRAAQAATAPLLSTPHVAVAAGFAFLAAPSGLLMRFIPGVTRPPDLTIVQDPLGLCLVAGLLLKEVPYLVLMLVAALGQIDAPRIMAAARALGYAPSTAWLKAVLPRVYPQIRLPVYAVLVFSMSVVDVAVILAPGTPPPLSPFVMRLMLDRDLTLQYPGAAGAVLQLLLALAAVGLWRLCEILVARLSRSWLTGGGRNSLADPAARIAAWIGAVLGLLAVLGAAGMAVWSFARSWRFPDLLPSAWTLANWQRALPGLDRTLWTTFACASGSALLAVILAAGCLENERLRNTAGASRRDRQPRALWLLYVPLLVPQIAFLFGAQVLLIRANLDGTWLALVWSHLLFVLPYVFLSLADPWRALDERYLRTAACLGRGPVAVFLRVTLPMLLRPVLFAFAIGFAVSVGLYLPTIFAGAGRFATLTTEAVTLSAGADRRVIGVHTLLQTAMPLAVYGIALAWTHWRGRRRRGLGR